MNIILLSGGSGKRLWPLSNDIRSKQFIKIFKKEDGEYESMVQRVYRQIKSVDKDAKITIATSKSQVSFIHNQLGEDVSISLEPSKRDTFPAIALATAYLVDILKINPSESVVVCPVDPYVDDNYFEKLKEISAEVEKEKASLVLMGIEPTYPSEKYGYILPSSKTDISCVREFKEKPALAVAQEYIKQGALWNGGVFAYKLSYMMAKAHELIDFVDYSDLFGKYDTLTKISFDYAVVEHEKSIEVVKYSGQWKDIGTWNTLTESMSEKIVGKGVIDDKSTNVHIINETNVPILVMGLHDVVISASPDGILVSEKNASSYIKPYVDKLERQIIPKYKSYSVLMPVYYKEKPEYLKQAIESIQKQTLPTEDFVLVCDGPLNAALDAVIEAKQQEMGAVLNVVRLEKNGGLGNALNEGINHCKNELVARMDSDDLAYPDRCERQLAVFNEHPEVSICSGIVEEFSLDPGVVDTRRIVPETNSEIVEFAKKRNPFNHTCVTYKKSAVQSVGSYQDFYLLEDYFLWIRMLMAGYQGYNIQEPLLHMRSGSSMYLRRAGFKYAKAQVKLIKFMKQQGFIDKGPYIKSCVLRSGSALAPNWLRMVMYKKILRK